MIQKILFLLVSLSLASVQAQESGINFKVGATAGLNKTNIIFSSTGGDGFNRWEPRNTLSLGVVGNLMFGPNFSLQSGVILTERGTNTRPLFDFDTRIRTLEIPVHIRYEYSVMGDELRTYGFGGVYWGYGLSSATATEKKWNKVEFGELYQRPDWGLAGGVGIAVNYGGIAADLQVKYSIGLKDIDADESLNSFIVNRNIALVYYFLQ